MVLTSKDVLSTTNSLFSVEHTTDLCPSQTCTMLEISPLLDLNSSFGLSLMSSTFSLYRM